MRRLVWMVGCLAMAGCSTLPFVPKQAPPAAATDNPSPATTSSPAPSAATVTAQEAVAILKDYVERNNTANKNKSDKLLATYEAGSSFAIDKAHYFSSRKLGSDAGYEPFSYTKPVHTVPATKKERWLLITAYFKNEDKTAKEPTYLLFTNDGESWRQVYAPRVFEGSRKNLPKLATDASGMAEEVAPSDGTGLMMSPAAFAKSYAAHLVNKGTAASRTHFAADRLTTDAASTRTKMRAFAKVTESARPATEFPTYALRTTDGGALTFTTLKRTIRYDVHQTPDRKYVYQNNNGFLRGKYYKFMQTTALIQIIAHIPPKTANPGQAEVLGTYSGIIAGRGR